MSGLARLVLMTDPPQCFMPRSRRGREQLQGIANQLQAWCFSFVVDMGGYLRRSHHSALPLATTWSSIRQAANKQLCSAYAAMVAPQYHPHEGWMCGWHICTTFSQLRALEPRHCSVNPTDSDMPTTTALTTAVFEPSEATAPQLAAASAVAAAAAACWPSPSGIFSLPCGSGTRGFSATGR
mmetsp:Transcript_62564/g.149247  ORF Transcript_62564/g.149247 Transcript_62564/m.149247 type:complete len:182 (+) Transcript_62564:196-741(+)